ncbi:MAG: ParB/RepB/Spo0J family partition protein, partial [Syntrophomonadaceae bacterium]|nr:ParB/RepB/Spo0J family partition protein [Syntrophomonadaceae bacterium]
MVKKHLEKLLGKNSAEKVVLLDMEKIRPNPYQPRKQFNKKEMLELAQSIQAYGLIQPIIVRQHNEGYQIIAGERRYRACKMLGLKEIPGIVHIMDDERVAAVSLIENLQRKELNYFEEASAYSLLINVFGMTQEELARKIGRSQSTIANKLRLLKLAPAVQCMICEDIITERHTRTLLKLNSPDTQIDVIKQIYEKDLTVKETELLVEKLSANNIPQDIKNNQTGQNVSMIIRDARIFLNTIRETVKRARQTGVDIVIAE